MSLPATIIQLLDDHSGQPLRTSARFTLDEQPCQPLAKPQAFYVLPTLPPGRYRLAVMAPTFRPWWLHVEVSEAVAARPLAERVLRCRLTPGPLYDYPAGTTLISGRLDAGPGQTLIAADYPSALGRPRRSETHGGDGRYLLALTGRLANPTQVTLSAKLGAAAGASGLPSYHQVLRVVPGSTSFVDIVLA